MSTSKNRFLEVPIRKLIMTTGINMSKSVLKSMVKE